MVLVCLVLYIHLQSLSVTSDESYVCKQESNLTLFARVERKIDLLKGSRMGRWQPPCTHTINKCIVHLFFFGRMDLKTTIRI